MTLERIVRPFQSLSVAPPRRVARSSEVAAEAENAILKVSAGGSPLTYTCSASAGNSRYMEAIQRETSRETFVERIENPDDPEQHLDVEVTELMKLTGPRGQKIEDRLKPRKPSATTSKPKEDAPTYLYPEDGEPPPETQNADFPIQDAEGSIGVDGTGSSGGGVEGEGEGGIG